jgi:hypothetical protein
MTREKTKLILAALLAITGMAMYVSFSATFMVILLGGLLVPPAFAISFTLIEGARLVLERMKKVPDEKKNSFVISV